MSYKHKGSRYVLSEGDAEIFLESADDARYFTEFYFDGIVLHDWQLAIHHALQSEISVCGGFGSGKTSMIAMSAMIHATTNNGFKFMNVADVAWQANQMYSWIVENLSESIWWKRFVKSSVEKPYPKIIIEYVIPASITGGKEEIVHSSLEFMSISDQGKHILSWEGDWANVDEAGIVDNLDTLIQNLGSRLRGKTAKGRGRMGRFSMTTNPWENDDFWYRYDQWELDPSTYLSVTIKTDMNKALDEQALKNLKRRITDGNYDRWLGGERPQPRGREFSAAAIDQSKIPWMAALMEELREEDGKKKCPMCGFLHESDASRCPNCSANLENVTVRHSDIYYQEAPRAGVVEWALPYDDTRTYLIVGDPGQGNPPNRNSPVIMVWDVTEFESKEGRADLRAFWWGFGNGKYEPFINKYVHYKARYGCFEATFDNTGTQQSFDVMFNILEEQNIQGTTISGQSKNHALVTLKLLLERQKLGWSAQIKGIGSQLGNYVIPDLKIAQDIVATMMIMALWLRRYYYAGIPGEPQQEFVETGEMVDRFIRRSGSRFEGRP